MIVEPVVSAESDNRDPLVSRSGVKWVDNAPRHGYVTMRLAKGNNVQSVAKAVGNSLPQIQKHYWNRNEAITKEIADEYFGIVPAGLAENTLAVEKAA